MKSQHAAAIMIAVLTIVAGAVVADDAPKAAPEATTWSFDADKADKPPAGFRFGRTGQGKEGKWTVLAGQGRSERRQRARADRRR